MAAASSFPRAALSSLLFVLLLSMVVSSSSEVVSSKTSPRSLQPTKPPTAAAAAAVAEADPPGGGDIPANSVASIPATSGESSSAEITRALAHATAAAASIPVESLPRETQQTILAQRLVVKECFPQLFNYTTPLVVDRTYFPKVHSVPPRFRFRCSMAEYPVQGLAKGVHATAHRPVALASYAVDGQHMPQYVAFRVERPVYGNSFVPGNALAECRAAGRGGGLEAVVSGENGITTQPADAVQAYNRELLLAGKDPWLQLVLAPLALPEYQLTCELKRAALELTGAVAFNRYLYEMNWARGGEALRKYVAGGVVPPKLLPGETVLQHLQRSDQYRPVYAVAGPHFTGTDALRFDAEMPSAAAGNATGKGGVPEHLPREYSPQGVWQAVVDPALVVTRPKSAAIAWYCDNAPRGPFAREAGPEGKGSSGGQKAMKAEEEGDLVALYEQGPKLCTTMSLDELARVAGVRPFPDLGPEVSAHFTGATWFLPDKF